MTKRDKVLALIAAEVASEGSVTAYAIRLYAENHISLAAFRAAINRGMICATAAIGKQTKAGE